MDIYNYNTKNIVEQNVYDSFNNLIFSNEQKLIGKLLIRFNFFEKIKHLPGDIVELGVFKGSGMATWLKFINLYIPNTNKKVIGFDIFNHTSETDTIINSYNVGNLLKDVINRVNKDDLTLNSVKTKLLNISDKFLLIQGDVKETTKTFVCENPGFRISLLYLDLDLEEPTYYALVNLWDNIVPGGYIIFDEYDYHKFDESRGVDRFLKEKSIDYSIQNTNFTAPTSFMIKKSF